ncbi:hypothetical protein Goari_001010, partial [Gossypium aridum]|nr:hypothetical protein [Gossypium aridum]
MGFNLLAVKGNEALVITYWAIYVIARNESGEILAACTYPHYGVVDAFTTEVRACEQKVAFAQELGFRSIVTFGEYSSTYSSSIWNLGFKT